MGEAGDTVFVTVLRPGAAGKARVPEARRSVVGGTEFVTLEDASGTVRAAFFAGGKGRAFGMSVEANALVLRGDGNDFLLSRSTSLRNAHGIIFESSAPADVSGGISREGVREMVVRLDAPALVRFRAHGPRPAITLSGETVRAEYDPTTGLASLHLPAGQHILATR